MATNNSKVFQLGGRRRASRAIQLMLAVSMACACFLGSGVSFAAPAGVATGATNYATCVCAAMLAVCCLLAKTESAAKPPAPCPIEKRGDWDTFMLMSALLSFTSGMVNAMAIIDMGMTISHHTGNTSHTGRLLGESATKFFRLMVAFAFGAGVAGFVKVDGEAVYQGRYSPGMLSAALAVVFGCMIRWFSEGDEDYADGRAAMTLFLWSWSQGMQNAISRKCSSMPVCTTHFTGYLTDFGSTLGGILQGAITGDAAPPPRKPLFFGLSIFTFGAGGYVSHLMRPSFGSQACLLPAAIMAAIAVGVVPLTKKG